MDKVKTYNLSDISDLIDSISTSEDWSVGADGDGGSVDSFPYIVLEELYRILDHRNETSSIKFFKNVSDALAYEWHCDNENVTETEIVSTALIYFPGCRGSTLEIKQDNVVTKYNPKAYDLIVFDSNVEHRATGKFHGPVMKYTFL